MWACRVGKRQQGPTHQNDSGRSNGSVSFSRKGASNKESTRPEYWTQDGSSGDGVLPEIADMVFQRKTAEAVATGRCNGEGKRRELVLKHVD